MAKHRTDLVGRKALRHSRAQTVSARAAERYTAAARTHGVNAKTAHGGWIVRAGQLVLWGGVEFSVLMEYDDDFVYLSCGDGAQLVHVSEIFPA